MAIPCFLKYAIAYKIVIYAMAHRLSICALADNLFYTLSRIEGAGVEKRLNPAPKIAWMPEGKSAAGKADGWTGHCRSGEGAPGLWSRRNI